MMIRTATSSDLPDILKIYAQARQIMKASGNPHQWGDNRPSEMQLRQDIEGGHLYVIIENETIAAAFFYDILEDPTYAVIENGAWLNNESYGVVHRIASNGTCRGILSAILEFAQKTVLENGVTNLRIDTHNDNKIMQHLLAKHGFSKCGIIYVEDGTPRIAYQLSLI